MNDGQAIRHIVLPQALRLSIPGWSNEFSILLKDSALCFVLGTPEIMARTHFVASRTYEHLPLYITAGLLYFGITLVGVHILRVLERKVHIPGYAVSEHHPYPARHQHRQETRRQNDPQRRVPRCAQRRRESGHRPFRCRQKHVPPVPQLPPAPGLRRHLA